MQLLHRSARGVELTPAGNAMLHHARQMLGQVDEMRAELSDYTKGGKGLVRVHANTSALAQYLSQDLASFSAAHPAIKIAIEEHRSGAIVQALQGGTTDIGIVMEGAPTGDFHRFDTAHRKYSRGGAAEDLARCAANAWRSRSSFRTTSSAWRAIP